MSLFPFRGIDSLTSMSHTGGRCWHARWFRCCCPQPTVVKLCLTWNRIHRVLHSDGGSTKVVSCFHKTTVQSVPLCTTFLRPETWVSWREMLEERLVNAFHLTGCCITGWHLQQLPDGKWQHPPLEEVLEICEMSLLSSVSTHTAAERKALILQTHEVSHSETHRQSLLWAIFQQTIIALCDGVILRLVLANNDSQGQSSQHQWASVEPSCWIEKTLGPGSGNGNGLSLEVNWCH